ncbi:MAG: cyclodeaminase/cyclohydrolase family protein [Peptococcaceae bacterium]|nr:cyclodeaminase/cyclohydrolase family protein [Peptococcaceae bacterium]
MTETLDLFLEDLASSKATPGGGGAAALAGALGAALGSMVINLTLGKKKYAQHEETLREVLKKTEALRRELKDLIAADAEAFAPLARAYGLPKDTPEELAEREKVMEEALAQAAAVPLEIMKKALEALELQQVLAEKGSRLAISDVACGARLLQAAVSCGEMNVYINTGLMKNRALALELEEKALKISGESRVLAEGICRQVLRQIVK